MSDNTLGTIELSNSSRLIFTISWWKGQQYANVRKHVTTSKYVGPTKSGLAMTGDVLVSVIDVLQRLKAEVPGPEERRFARVPKAENSEIVFTIIPPDDLKRLPSVDVRQYVDSPGYTGPTKKGVRFPWDKLPEVIAIMQTQAQHMGDQEKKQPILFPKSKPKWVDKSEHHEQAKMPRHDMVLAKILPDGPKKFPEDFLADQETDKLTVQLPTEPIEVSQQPDGKYVVRSSFGFYHPVRNAIEGNFVFYSYLRGHKNVYLPKEMIVVFRTVKAYENYLRELRHSLIQEYERKSGHKPMAEHRAKEIFRDFGLPWIG